MNNNTDNNNQNNNNIREISKIQIRDQVYNIKDEELREMICQFIGDVQNESEIRKTEDSKL